MLHSAPQELEVWGDLACFTRPELKVERLSYPFITPSAARGIFDAIYWKPALRWVIRRIELLRAPRFIALRRNEVQTNPLSDRTIKSWMTGKAPVEPLFADEERTQRQTMAIKGPHYRITAEIRPHPDRRAELASMVAQFRRRASRGQCFTQPSFGCREFVAYFRLLEAEDPRPSPIPLDLDVGWMVHDTFDAAFTDKAQTAQISVFHARATQGVVEVPLPESPLVRRPQVEVR